jgi:hypothetical protein
MKRGKSVDFTGYWQRRIVGSDRRQSVMVARTPLAEIAIYSIAVPAIVSLCLWVLLGPLRTDRDLGAPFSELAPEVSGTAAIVAVPGAGGDSGTATVGPAPAAKADSGAATIAPAPGDKADTETPTVILFPGDDGRLLAQIQGALIAKGYSVGPTGADGNDSTLTALEAFQDDQALPVQPKCDQQCRTALGLPNPQ